MNIELKIMIHNKNSLNLFQTLVIGMLAMGMTTDPMQMLKYLKKPVGPLIGVLCQFLIMPCITMIAITIVDFASKYLIRTNDILT